jgi:hypothetical protein
MAKPEHPDLDRILESVLWMDGEATEGGRTFLDIIAEFDVDPESAVWVAGQRVLRARMEALNEPMTDQSAMALWLEAFFIGLRMGRRQGGDGRE